MEESMYIEYLSAFGLTRQEAQLYLALSRGGTQTGYEIAKATGISRSNAYGGLSALTEKGAAYVTGEKTKKYAPVNVEEFCSGKLRSLRERKSWLKEHMPCVNQETEGYLTITGDEGITGKICAMLGHTRQRIYLSISSRLLQGFLPDLNELSDRGIKVVILTDKPVELSGAQIYLTGDKGSQIGLITDSGYVLTGELGQGSSSVSLYSDQKNFVKVFKDSLSNEIKLIELTRKK